MNAETCKRGVEKHFSELHRFVILKKWKETTYAGQKIEMVVGILKVLSAGSLLHEFSSFMILGCEIVSEKSLAGVEKHTLIKCQKLM